VHSGPGAAAVIGKFRDLGRRTGGGWVEAELAALKKKLEG